PTTRSPSAALRDGPAMDLHGRGRRGGRCRARRARRAPRDLRRLRRVARSGHRGFALRAGSLVAAASVAAVLGVAAAGWHSSPPAPTAQSGVVRPSEIVVGWNTSDLVDGRLINRPARPTP